MAASAPFFAVLSVSRVLSRAVINLRILSPECFGEEPRATSEHMPDEHSMGCCFG